MYVYEDASKALKAGSYSFTMELLDEDGIPFCKPSKATLEFSNLNCCKSNDEEPRLLNDNIKGKYNNITDYLEIEAKDFESGELHNYTIKVKDGKALPDEKSVTGYVEYNVEYTDGTTELRRDKITVNIKKQNGKYSIVANKKNNSPVLILSR